MRSVWKLWEEGTWLSLGPQECMCTKEGATIQWGLLCSYNVPLRTDRDKRVNDAPLVIPLYWVSVFLKEHLHSIKLGLFLYLFIHLGWQFQTHQKISVLITDYVFGQ